MMVNIMLGVEKFKITGYQTCVRRPQQIQMISLRRSPLFRDALFSTVVKPPVSSSIFLSSGIRTRRLARCSYQAEAAG